ncbi:hypothetical protein GWK47_051842 [Chionoecetes opilio]|uniref:Uncharacterized protein n=1 Tax=Chionoecetes opilio TaxID=41210 RepID=A0A8J4Y218_CHIOP|nr:hypothetical protein GWK47_051842 [Chionoecetes opilio]
MSDASDVGGGYQTPDGRRGFSAGGSGWSQIHINIKELLVPLLFLRSNPIPEGTALCFEWTTWSRSTVSPAKGHPKICPSVVPFGADLRPGGPFPPSSVCRVSAGSGECVGRRPVSFSGARREWQLRPERFAALSGVGHSGDGPLRVPPLCPTTGF